MADILKACSSHGRKFDKQKKKLNFSVQENLPGPSPTNTPRRNQHHWKNNNRPSFCRLDSTGENSASSSEDLNGGFSPEIQVFNRCGSRFNGRSNLRPRFPEQEHRSFTGNHQTQSCGLIDKVKCVFGTRNQHLPPQSRRNTTRNLAYQLPSNNPDTRLASLDSVAEKFTNMSMENVNNKHWGSQNWQGQYADACRGPTNRGPLPQGQWGRTSNVLYDRNHTPIFHPYQGMNQSPLLSSTLNYQRNFFPQPWQHMMGFNHNSHLPFNQGFHHFTQPWQQQRSHPPYPWQQWVGPQMMQACGNQRPMTRQHQEKVRSPKKQKWSRYRSSQQKRTCPPSKSGPLAENSQPFSTQAPLQVPTDTKSPVVEPALVTEVKEDDMVSKDEPLVDSKKGFDGAICSVEESKIEHDKEHIAVQNEKTGCQTSPTCKPEVPQVQDGLKTQNEAVQRHSTIDLILSDYEVQSCTQGEITTLLASSDSEVSDGDSDSAVETNADLWESFTVTDDPYNPLCGWRCRKSIQEVSPGMMSIQDCHVDSGTDEGDNWSETDSDDDYDSADDIPDDVPDDVPNSLPQSLKLSDPQLKELRENLSSTPKDKADQTPIHHPSLAFILGSQLSSSEDDDDDWDTLDDHSNLQDDPLWDSFNRAQDPYSPMEAWKCSASNLSSSVAVHSSNQTTPIRNQDSVEGLRTIASTERGTSPQLCEEKTPRDSDGKSFPISTVRVYTSKDDIDLGSPIASVAALKRVASASCLRKVQLTPQDKATKKVRFCPNSSFIVLVEKDPLLACENDPSQVENDWQACARDRMRFKARIDQLSQLLNPVLTNEHRERVYASHMASEGYR